MFPQAVVEHFKKLSRCILALESTAEKRKLVFKSCDLPLFQEAASLLDGMLKLWDSDISVGDRKHLKQCWYMFDVIDVDLYRLQHYFTRALACNLESSAVKKSVLQSGLHNVKYFIDVRFTCKLSFDHGEMKEVLLQDTDFYDFLAKVKTLRSKARIACEDYKKESNVSILVGFEVQHAMVQLTPMVKKCNFFIYELAVPMLDQTLPFIQAKHPRWAGDIRKCMELAHISGTSPAACPPLEPLHVALPVVEPVVEPVALPVVLPLPAVKPAALPRVRRVAVRRVAKRWPVGIRFKRTKRAAADKPRYFKYSK